MLSNFCKLISGKYIFEQALIDLRCDDDYGLDDYVLTSKISELENLSLFRKNTVSSLIGIEDYTNLKF